MAIARLSRHVAGASLRAGVGVRRAKKTADIARQVGQDRARRRGVDADPGDGGVVYALNAARALVEQGARHGGEGVELRRLDEAILVTALELMRAFEPGHGVAGGVGRSRPPHRFRSVVDSRKGRGHCAQIGNEYLTVRRMPHERIVNVEGRDDLDARAIDADAEFVDQVRAQNRSQRDDAEFGVGRRAARRNAIGRVGLFAHHVLAVVILVAERAEDAVVLREVVVNAKVVLREVGRDWDVPGEPGGIQPVADPEVIGTRHQREHAGDVAAAVERGSNRIAPVKRDSLQISGRRRWLHRRSRKRNRWRHGNRIGVGILRAGEEAEQPLPHCLGEDGRRPARRLPRARAFVVEVEEGLLFENGAADAPSVLVADQYLARGSALVVEEGVGGKRGVAMLVKKAAAIIVATRTADENNLPGAASKLGVRGRGHDAKFRNPIHGDRVGGVRRAESVEVVILNVPAVECDVETRGARPVEYLRLRGWIG
ncbi:MAG: hypothetical protein JMDDDDMK_05473 [Acidobacteria bacterium]|nr:hypothetical protein [Acidobacteriota bacterium]